MKGDFSKLRFAPDPNYSGVLMQQGRVLLDSDWNSQSQIHQRRLDQTGRDAFGAGSAAVPEDNPNGFKVQAARKVGDGVIVDIEAGHIWADGILVHQTEPASLAARYLTAPVQNPSFDPSSIVAGVRDVVVLEIRREALNGFQRPMELIEPALGGPDTTERLLTAATLRLFRLGPGQHCGNINLTDNNSFFGSLQATLQPSVEIDGDCPQLEGGGYTGFEHALYRIEIAEANQQPGAMFKWSAVNGGLTGRGLCDLAGVNPQLSITAGDQAILMSNRSEFYLEVIEQDSQRGEWRVTYGAEVALNGSILNVETEHYVENSRPTGRVFFRLWNGIGSVSQFLKPALPNEPKELIDGIRLAFDPDTSLNYRPGDYWTFKVRAGNIPHREPLLENQPPQGVIYHRAPLAELTWNNAGDLRADRGNDEIHDCRRSFPSLSQIPRGCCRAVHPQDHLHLVIQEVISNGGGCICLLPGDHYLLENVEMKGVHGLTIQGAGPGSRLHIKSQIPGAAFHLENCRHIHFKNFSIFNQRTQTVWTCLNSSHLSIEGMWAWSPLSGGGRLIQASGGGCFGWILEDNTFISATTLDGSVLGQSRIQNNLFLGVIAGIHMSDLLEVQLQGNRFHGLDGSDAKLVDTRFMGKPPLPVSAQLELTSAILSSINELNARRFTGILASGLFDCSLKDNSFTGRSGIRVETIEKGEIHENQFLNRLFAADCGLVEGLRFTANRIGRQADENSDEPAILTAVGLRIQADAVEISVTQNLMVNVGEGVVFESDLDGEQETARDFQSQLMEKGEPGLADAANLMSLAEKDTAQSRSIFRLLPSPFFIAGTCRRVTIHDNLINALKVGIDWSGTKNIVDFRITGNTFQNCEEIAIRIEPKDTVFFLAEPVDTKVRIIEKNRFDIKAVAVRSTIGATRIEKNDIRIRNQPAGRPPWRDAGRIVGNFVMRDDKYNKAAEKGDFPAMHLLSGAALKKGEQEANSIEFKGLGDNLKELSQTSPKGALWDAALTLRGYAAAGDTRRLLPAVRRFVYKSNTWLEGYVVNLTGIQNRVVHNRIRSGNPDLANGILIHQHADEIRDNEVVVRRIALLINPKSSTVERNMAIEGNRLVATGETSNGRTIQVYALVITGFTPGHISMIGNHLEGSVALGANPFVSYGFVRPQLWEATNELVFYNGVKYEAASYHHVLAARAITVKETPVLTVNPDLLMFPGDLTSRPTWNADPHSDRPIVQFADNRVVRGWTTIAQTSAGAFWNIKTLAGDANRAMIVQLTNNLFDYGAKVAGYDLVITGNHGQRPVQFRVGRNAARTANIPEPVTY